MAGKTEHERLDAKIDEALRESFPASDPPAWTLGIDDNTDAVTAPKGGRYITREAVLKLLSDDEIARVATLESAEQLTAGEEYIDLARPERGVLHAEAGCSLDMGHVLPRSAVGDETWSRILREVHRGWQSPDSPP